MYHYSNQSIYNYDVYSQCSVVDLNKNLNETISLTEHNQYQSNTENVSFTTLTTSHSTPTETRNNGTERKEKLTEKTVVDTSNFSIEERLVAAVWVHERKRTNVGMSQIKRDFRQRFGRQPPAKNTLLAWERKLFSTGSVRDAPRPGRPVNRLKRVEEVAASVRSTPSLSVRARSRALGLPLSTLRAILRRDLHTTPTQTNQHQKGKFTRSKVTMQAAKKMDKNQACAD